MCVAVLASGGLVLQRVISSSSRFISQIILIFHKMPRFFLSCTQPMVFGANNEKLKIFKL